MLCVEGYWLKNAISYENLEKAEEKFVPDPELKNKSAEELIDEIVKAVSI